MADTTDSPRSMPSSPSFGASTSSSRTSPPTRPVLSLDLSNLPPLSQPSPPSNTLLITDLDDKSLFQPSSLDSIRQYITSRINAPLNSFSPLPSFRRIVCSFRSVEDALRARKLLDAEPLRLGRAVRARIYFGEPTPILDHDRPRLLAAPQLDKLFFISPPPSPPHGWVMRNEEPPNKAVHASDLADALVRLNTHAAQQPLHRGEDPVSPVSACSDTPSTRAPSSLGYQTCPGQPRPPRQRSRSSTIIYQPQEHGGSAGLPAVLVEDFSADDSSPLADTDVLMHSPADCYGAGGDDRTAAAARRAAGRVPPKTARPPVELMES